MGKYMRKSKFTDDVVAVMDVSLGVRTRARTLAMQKLQNHELSYLQLRNRRLEKPPLQQQNPNPSKGGLRLVMNSGLSGSVGSGSISEQGRVLYEAQIEEDEEPEEACDLDGEEASFGENNIGLDGRERSTRESTPCSLIRDSSVISTPGSTTRPTNLEASRITRNPVQRVMPLAQEIEEFFARHEQEQQQRFSEKYNFDVVSEKPTIKGRYEWVRVESQ